MPDYFMLVRGGPWVSKELKTYFGRLMNPRTVRMEVFGKIYWRLTIRNSFAYPVALEPGFSRQTALLIRWNSRVGRIFPDTFTSFVSFAAMFENEHKVTVI